MSYYTDTIYIPEVDKNDKIIGKIERWEAHKLSILHRGFTIAVYNSENKILLQHRKHPVFDNYFDLTASSHQIFEGDSIQEMNSAILNTLKREWNISKDMISDQTELVGKILYKSSDGIYTEHELCHLYRVNLKKKL